MLGANGRLELLVLDLRLALLEDVAEEEGGVEGFDAVRLVVEFSIGALDARAAGSRAGGRLGAVGLAACRFLSLRICETRGLLVLAASLRWGEAERGVRRRARRGDDGVPKSGRISESGDERGAERGAPPECWATVPRGRRSET